MEHEATCWAFGGTLALGAAAMIVMHVRALRRTEASNPDEADLHFAQRQCRRRVQATGMLGAVGLAIASLPFLSQQPTLAYSLVILMVVLSIWAMLLAVGDYASTQVQSRNQVNRELREIRREAEELVRQAKLKQEQQAQSNELNGQSQGESEF